MNRVIIEVLPTDWSPKKTSLYFWRGVTEALLKVGANVGLAAISHSYMSRFQRDRRCSATNSRESWTSTGGQCS